MCTLLDMGCHVQTAAWEWWAGVGLLNKLLIVGGLLAVVLGCSWGLLKLVRQIGGWPAVVGFVAAALGLVLALLPRRPETAPPFTGGEVAPRSRDAEFPFGVDRVRPKKKRKTLQDLWRR